MKRLVFFLASTVCAGMTVFGDYQTALNWTVNPAESGTSWATWSTVLTNGDVIATGFSDINGFAQPRVMRIDPSGTVLLDHVYSTALTEGYPTKAIYTALLPNGHVFVGCTLEGSSSGAYFMSLNENGALLSESLVNALPLRFSHTTNSEIFVAGSYGVSLFTESGAFLKSGQLVTNGFASGISVCQTSDGGYLVGGKAGDQSLTLNHALLAKLDADLDLVWSRRYVMTNGNQTVFCAIENPDGTITACGQEGSGTLGRNLLFKTAADGAPLWAATRASGDGGGLNTVIATADNEAIVVGAAYGSPFMARYGAGGAELWSYYRMGSGMLRSVSSVAPHTYVASGFSGLPGASSGGDWLTLCLTETFDSPIIVTELLPFEPTLEHGGAVATAAGDTTLFSFEGHDPDGPPLSYLWSLNEIPVTNAASYLFTALPEMAGQTRSVGLHVHDALHTLSYTWFVTISNRATVVTQLLPFEPTPAHRSVTVRVGSAETFSFQGLDPDGNALQYRWLLDGLELSTTNFCSYQPRLEDANAVHMLTLTVTVIPGVESASYAWLVSVPELFGPHEAVPVSPANGENGVSSGKRPTLAWSFSEDESHPVQWSKVYFSQNQHSVTYLFPDAEVLNDGVTCYTNYTAPSALANEATYYWCVVGYNAAGTATSPVYSFTTASEPQPPYEPYALSPWDNSSGVWFDAETTVKWGFGWDAGHPVDRCDLYFSTNQSAVAALNPTVRALSDGPAPDGSYSSPGALLVNQTYYWRVVGHNAIGSSTGSVWSFTTESQSTLPTEFNFEGYPTLPLGWSTRYNDSVSGGLNGANLQTDWGGWGPMYSAALIHSGSGALGMFGGMPALHWLVSPLFQPTSTTELRAWVYYGPDEWMNAPAPLHLLVKSEAGWQVVRSWSPAVTNHFETEVSVSLAAYVGKTVRIAWVYDLSLPSAPVALDDLRLTDGAGADSDGDGLADAWELTHLSGLSQGANDDADTDGMINIDEFVAGTDPSDAASTFRITAIQRGTDSIIRWNAVSGRRYSVYWCLQLTNVFQCLENTIAWPQSTYTNATKGASGYYTIGVRLAE